LVVAELLGAGVHAGVVVVAVLIGGHAVAVVVHSAAPESVGGRAVSLTGGPSSLQAARVRARIVSVARRDMGGSFLDASKISAFLAKPRPRDQHARKSVGRVTKR
jgi:hypothetical protein